MVETRQQRESCGAEATEGGEAHLAIPGDPLTSASVEHGLVYDGLHRDPENGVGIEASLR